MQDPDKKPVIDMRKEALAAAKIDIVAYGTGKNKHIADGQKVTLSQKQFDLLSKAGAVTKTKKAK